MPIAQILCMAFVTLVNVSVVSALAVCYALGSGMTSSVAAAGFTFGAAAAICWIPACGIERRILPSRLSMEGSLVFGACSLVLAELMRRTVWIEDGWAKVNNLANYGDLPLHLTYIQYIANGARWWPDNPILSGAETNYPLGMDAFNAMLVLLGLGPENAFVIVGVLSAVVTATALLLWGGAFTVAAFTFSGSILAFEHLGIFSVGVEGMQSFWKNLPLVLFNPQRGLNYALPAGLLLLHSWRLRFVRGVQSAATLPVAFEVLCYSSMPLFHMHSFVFLSSLLVLWFLFIAEARAGILRLIALSLLPATAIVYEMTNGFGGLSIVDLRLVWAGNGFAPFWFWNFGVLCVLVPLTAHRAFQRGSRCVEWRIVLPALMLVGLLSVLKLQPNPWDNMKSFMWCYLLLLPALHSLIVKELPVYLRLAFYIVLIAPGVAELWAVLRPSNPGAKLYEVVDVRNMEEALERIPLDERLATFPTFNHPVALAGHPVALGYPGHIWVHGFDYVPVERKLHRLMMGDPRWRELAKELTVRYVFWGELEESGFPGSARPWESDAPVMSGEWGKVYVVR